QYLDWRTSKVSANREVALFSHLWNWARSKGITDLPNPCGGIRRNKERGRDVYIDDTTYRAVYQAADQTLRDAMDLAYLTGQRVSDVVNMDERHIVNGALEICQAKTGVKLAIAITGELA
ncbi:integrase, partial [Xylella fastidiosa subsp. multiplex]|nr:integrase [Xylella fastidiosa subsp. multiplex]